MMRNFRLLFCIFAVAVTMLNSCGKGEDAPPPTDPTTTNPDSDSDSDPTTTKFTITFDANGGSVSPASAETDDKGRIASLPTPTLDGFAFEGWFTAATGGDKITAETLFTVNTTIYAQWVKSKFTITLDVATNGGVVSNPTVETNSEGVVVDLPVPTNDDRVFKGWYTTADGNEEVTLETVFDDDVTIYAQWNYKITFDANGGDEVPSQSAGKDNKLSELQDATYEGHEFMGWFTTSTGDEEVTIETVFDADVTIYAQWAKLNRVSLNGDGGTTSSASLYANVEGKIDLSQASATRDGCNFEGWYTQKNGAGEMITADKVFTEDATIYAHWSINFRDDKFKEWVLSNAGSKDSNSDGEISPKEALAFTSFGDKAKNTGITSLVGISLFANLEYLYCRDEPNIIAALLDKNTKLKNIDLSKTGIEVLILPNGGYDLTSLICNNADLVRHNLVSNSRIYSLDLSYNRLSGVFDVSNMPNLDALNISYNNITSLILSRTTNSGISYIFCSGNKISSLDISFTDVPGSPNILFGSQQDSRDIIVTVTQAQKTEIEGHMNNHHYSFNKVHNYKLYFAIKQ